MTAEEALREIDRRKPALTVHEVQTLRGQVRAGNVEAAIKGLTKLINRRRLRDGI